MSAWIVSVLVLIVVEAICLAVLTGAILLAFWRFRSPHAGKPH